ncbi:MAG: hypothetical protein ACYCPM_11245, partial [Acidobacteriaceae bacterium]
MLEDFLAADFVRLLEMDFFIAMDVFPLAQVGSSQFAPGCRYAAPASFQGPGLIEEPKKLLASSRPKNGREGIFVNSTGIGKAIRQLDRWPRQNIGELYTLLP